MRKLALLHKYLFFMRAVNGIFLFLLVIIIMAFGFGYTERDKKAQRETHHKEVSDLRSQLDEASKEKLSAELKNTLLSEKADYLGVMNEQLSIEIDSLKGKLEHKNMVLEDLYQEKKNLNQMFGRLHRKAEVLEQENLYWQDEIACKQDSIRLLTVPTPVEVLKGQIDAKFWDNILSVSIFLFSCGIFAGLVLSRSVKRKGGLLYV